MIEPTFFALRSSAAGSLCSPCSYHSGTRPRNRDPVHLKLIITLGGINWSYKKQGIVEIALLLSRQKTLMPDLARSWKEIVQGAVGVSRFWRLWKRSKVGKWRKTPWKGGHERCTRSPCFCGWSRLVLWSSRAGAPKKDTAWMRTFFWSDHGIRIADDTELQNAGCHRVPEGCRLASWVSAKSWLVGSPFTAE